MTATTVVDALELTRIDLLRDDGSAIRLGLPRWGDGGWKDRIPSPLGWADIRMTLRADKHLGRCRNHESDESYKCCVRPARDSLD